MLRSGWGRVINVASIAGKTGAPYIAAYSASKHGVLGLTRSVALEVATKGITVNAICPGYVDTEMTTRAVENITAKTGHDRIRPWSNKKMSPQNRLIMPEEVAALALLLASEEGRGINGQAINVDGGSVCSRLKSNFRNRVLEPHQIVPQIAPASCAQVHRPGGSAIPQY